MSRAFDVLVVGELNADLILNGDVTPEFGQVEKLIDDATLTIGSSSAIFACGAARLGLKVTFAGKIGSDTFGQFMLDALAARGVDTSHIIVDKQIKTGLSVILSTPTDRAILTYSGSIAALRYDEVDWRILEQARHIHMGSYFLLDALLPDVPALFARAKQHGLSVSLDTNYDPSEKWDSGLSETLRHVDIFLPNETELLRVARQTEIPAALDTLSKIVPMVAVKRGAQGGLLRAGDTTLTAQTIPVDVVDTTGAGDSFNAGFVYGYLHGWQPERSLRLACICGALSTRGAGGTGYQPTLTEIEPFLNPAAS